MLSYFDPVLLARIQFAFTISFHIIFPAFTIGLASWLCVLEFLWLTTQKHVYEEIYRMWLKIFAVAFGMGVVSGVVMSYQFGTNWAVFSDRLGNILGPLMGFEVLTAFFLEASFFGIMLFGWNKVSPRMHFAATAIVAVGTIISAFWILAANSWMHTPQGYMVGDHGVIYPTNWWEIIFNPSFPYRFFHMISGAYLTTAFVVGGVGSYYLLQGRYKPHAQVMLGMAMIMAACLGPLQMLIGDLHGLNTLKHQPAKIAALEGIWETERSAPLMLFAIPDQENERNLYEIAIPKLGSLVLTHDIDGEIRGLKSWPKDERPPVIIPFFCFRIMVGIGVLMVSTGMIAASLYYRQKLFTSRPFHYWCLLLTPSGFIAVLSGWFVTEVGRQPYVAYGILKTKDAISPVIGEFIA
jgi:cytochrome d ubiquinol oxidase subunit I